MSAPPTAGSPHCSRCGGRGVVVSPGAGEFAKAEVCSCVGVCPVCDSTGRVPVERDGMMAVGRCRCQMLPDRAALLNHARLPSRHASSTFMSYNKDVEGVALGFVRTFGWLEAFEPEVENRGLILHGQVGRGKTHLLVAVLRELILRHGVEVRFVEFSRLLGLLKEGYSRGQSDTTLLTELANVPVLAIDELGKGRLTDWELSVIDDVVSRRYNAMGCTLATTNYGPGAANGGAPPNLSVTADITETLGDRVGERVYSRLQEMCDFVETKGPDYREIRR